MDNIIIIQTEQTSPFLHSKPIPKGDHLTYKYNRNFQTVLDLMMIY